MGVGIPARSLELGHNELAACIGFRGHSCSDSELLPQVSGLAGIVGSTSFIARTLRMGSDAGVLRLTQTDSKAGPLSGTLLVRASIGTRIHFIPHPPIQPEARAILSRLRV